MAAPPRRWAAELLQVWFHRLGPDEWFNGSRAVDAMLGRRFAWELAALAVRPAREFLTDPQMALGAVLLFDQFPRNIHRGTPEAFATDGLARSLTRAILRRGWLERLPREAKAFALMPLMHSERLADQRLSLTLFARAAPENLPFARAHHRMIARFGRFPHRNAILGRRSTPAEAAAVAAGNAW